MSETDTSGQLSPQDEQAAERFFQEIGLDEVPTTAHRGYPTLELTIRHSRVDIANAALERLSQISDPYDLLTPEARQRLSEKLEENDRIYRQGLNDALDLPLG